MYGIESTTTDIHLLVDDIERVLLDFVATSMLRCSWGTSESPPVLLRKQEPNDEVDGEFEGGVVGIRYSGAEQMTTLCELPDRITFLHCLSSLHFLLTIQFPRSQMLPNISSGVRLRSIENSVLCRLGWRSFVENSS